MSGGWSRLHRIGLIVELDNLFGNVDLVGTVDDRAILCGIINDYAETVLLGIGLNNLHHLLAYGVDGILLSFVTIVTERLLVALAATLQVIDLPV